MTLFGKNKPGTVQSPTEVEGDRQRPRYQRLWFLVVISTAFVSLLPMVVMTVINFYQYQKAFQTESVLPIARLTSNTRSSLEFFLEERSSALNFIIHDRSFEELSDQLILTWIFKNMKDYFGGFVDVGLFDENGIQQSYVGPYGLKGKSYSNQPWFEETIIKGSYISNVFLGFRELPHFVIAVKNERKDGRFYILRATFNADILSNLVNSLQSRPTSDVFITNRDGVFQTGSRFSGKILGQSDISVPKYSEQTEVIEVELANRQPAILGYAFITESPFVLMVVEKHETLMQNWLSLRSNLLIFLMSSMVLTLIVILVGSKFLINKLQEADLRRTAILHKVEYTNKMASIGRLAAGVAHEINNPLAIINEKAGLLQDLVAFENEFTNKDKFNKITESIIKSVARCSKITHRLLGFAKHMDVVTETIDMCLLLQEVMGFLDKECAHSNVALTCDFPDDLPTIRSDRGQLQQVFLNIINNAVAAIESGGKINISIKMVEADKMAIIITDSGVGIPPETLSHIFEPFFTTKTKYGTGLGLSITYGIVEKLGGKIRVESKIGVGTTFTVILTVN
jgi:two-component system, NtrC family, sensor kinase